MAHSYGESKHTLSAWLINAIPSLVGYPRKVLLQVIRRTMRMSIPLKNSQLKVFNTTKASWVSSNGPFLTVDMICIAQL
jgi:hypothetical protein